MKPAKNELRDQPVQGHSVPRLLTVRDVARLLAVSETTVYRLKGTGQMSFLKIGGALRFRPEDVGDYQNRQVVVALGYPAKESKEAPRLNLAFPLKNRRGRGI